VSEGENGKEMEKSEGWSNQLEKRTTETMGCKGRRAMNDMRRTTELI
jgi:hypothetical protein